MMPTGEVYSWYENNDRNWGCSRILMYIKGDKNGTEEG